MAARARAARPDMDPGGPAPSVAPVPVAPVPALLLRLQEDAGNQAVGQLVRGAERQAAFNAALAGQDWPGAADALAGMSPEDQQAALGALSEQARAQLRAAAPAPVPAGPDVAAMSEGDKLLKAWGYAQEHLAPDVVAQVAGLFTPQSLAMLAGFGAAYVAAQLTPVGWVADGIALATLTISAIFVGRVVFDVFGDIGTYLGTAVHATTDQELRRAGAALSHAIAEGGVGLVVALVGKAIGGSAGRPYEGPPPTGYVEALTTEGVLIRMPVEAAAEVAPSALQQAALAYAVPMSPPPGPQPSGGGDGTGGPPPRGEEIWQEISDELTLDPADLEPAPADAAQAAADARAAGLIGARGQPGTADLATQPHKAATEVRGEYGVSGRDVQSAHVGPTSALRDTPGYRRGEAETVLLDKDVHAAFDKHWLTWARQQRAAGLTEVPVSQLYTVMLDAIDQIPGIAQRMKNAMAWRLQLELFRDLGLRPTDPVRVPGTR